MTTASLQREVAKLKGLATARTSSSSPILTDLRADPARILAAAGMTADDWQETVLRSGDPRVLMLCSRQAGKSRTAAALALRSALLAPPALVLLLSPSLRQSGELFRGKLLPLYSALGRPVAVRQESALQMTLANGSRIVSLPGTEATVRCFSSVGLLVIDEAARVPDDLYRAVRPMLAVSKGKLVALSTAYAKQGFFYSEWVSDRPWRRVKITAPMCPRITPAFLEEERQALGPRWFAMEYMGEFQESIDSVFPAAVIQAAFETDAAPLFV